MRNLFSTRLVAVLLLIAAACLGLAAYTAVAGESSPVTAAIGTVLSPFQKGVSFVEGKAAHLIDHFNAFDALDSMENDMPDILITDIKMPRMDGLELIEFLSLDCTARDGEWHSDSEIKIDKLGYVIRGGKKTKEFWDGTIQSEKQPLRLKIRNICGDETVWEVSLKK